MSEETKVIRERNAELSIGSWMSGLFSTVSEEEFQADFTTKMGCFHIDFLNDKNYTIIEVHKEPLLNALLELDIFVNDQIVTFKNNIK